MLGIRPVVAPRVADVLSLSSGGVYAGRTVAACQVLGGEVGAARA